MSEKALTIKMSRGVLSIQIGAQTLKGAAERHEEFWQPQTDKVAVVVNEPKVFAQSVFEALSAEREDGSTLVTDMLDAAIKEAIEQGSEGLDYDAMEAIEAAERRATVGEPDG